METINNLFINLLMIITLNCAHTSVDSFLMSLHQANPPYMFGLQHPCAHPELDYSKLDMFLVLHV